MYNRFMKIIGNDWDDVLGNEFEKDYYQEIRRFLDDAYKTKVIYPKAKDLYRALRLTSYQDTKVVIFGQDPYHEEGQATGLAFSVDKGTKVPPSLINIYKEINAELKIKFDERYGDLTKWAKEGVLLLNSVLTVEAHKANSHKDIGWKILTDKITEALDKKEGPLVFMLWGRNARDKKALLHNERHLILEAAHPSPLSAYNGFFGCGHFKKANEYLLANGLDPIDWSL